MSWRMACASSFESKSTVHCIDDARSAVDWSIYARVDAGGIRFCCIESNWSRAMSIDRMRRHTIGPTVINVQRSTWSLIAASGNSIHSRCHVIQIFSNCLIRWLLQWVASKRYGNSSRLYHVPPATVNCRNLVFPISIYQPNVELAVA